MQVLLKAVYHGEPSGGRFTGTVGRLGAGTPERVQEVEPCAGETELGCDWAPLSLFGLKDRPGVSSLKPH